MVGSILPPISRVSKITLPLQEHFVCIMALSNDFSTELIDLKQQYPRDITPVKGKGFYSHSCYKLKKTNAPFTPKSSYTGVSLIFGASIFEFVCE